MPLSPNGLCEAEITAPGAVRAAATVATPGVGSTPRSTTSAPSVARPAENAAWNRGPERRVSRPTTKVGAGRIRAVARPRARASSAVSSSLATPRTPSVPKRAGTWVALLRALDYRLEYCGALRAFFRPYFFDSFSRASRVKRPGALERAAVLGVDVAEAARDAQAHARRPGPRSRRRRSWRRCRSDSAVFVMPQRLGDQHAVRRGGEVLLEGLLVDRDGALAGAEAHARHRLLAAAGGLAQWYGHGVGGVLPTAICAFCPLDSAGGPPGLGQVERLGLLGGVRVLGAGVDVELAQLLAAQGVLGQHAAHGAADQLGRLVLEQRGVAGRSAGRPGSRCGGTPSWRRPCSRSARSCRRSRRSRCRRCRRAARSTGGACRAGSAATSEARRPRTRPSASTTYQARWISLTFGENVRTGPIFRFRVGGELAVSSLAHGPGVPRADVPG